MLVKVINRFMLAAAAIYNLLWMTTDTTDYFTPCCACTHGVIICIQCTVVSLH